MPRLLVATLCLIAVTLVVSAVAVSAAADKVLVTNFRDGETVRYPVVFLSGTVDDAAVAAVTVVNGSSQRPTREMTGIAYKGRFKALMELVPGDNQLVVRAEKAEQRLVLRYKPQTNPQLVRMIYWTASDGRIDYQTPLAGDKQDFRGKLDTALKITQSFTAERLNELGLGRKTFNLELDADGKVIVHVMRGDKTMDEYGQMDGNQLYGQAYDEVRRKLPPNGTHHLIIPAFTRFDPATKKVHAHTALGGGEQALFGGGTLYSWPNTLADVQPIFMDGTPVDPNQVLDDSVGRRTIWANASTTIGAALHELGHTFGLPHTHDPEDIMTRGIDRFNRFFTFVDPPHAGRKEPYEFAETEIGYWPPVSGGILAAGRFFALDARQWRDQTQTAIRLDRAARQIVVQSDNGVRYVGVTREIKGEGNIGICSLAISGADKAPARVGVPLIDIGRKVGTRDCAVRVFDGEGLETSTSMGELLSGPFVQAWQVSPATKPWAKQDAFPDVNADWLKEVATSAAGAGLSHSPTPYVDLLRWVPGEPKENVAGYAARTIRSDRARKVKVLTGSDDGIRVWVDGAVVQQVLAFRHSPPDTDTATAELQAGENRLVVEVTQGGADWGFYLRLTEENGTPLNLADSGELTPVSAEADKPLLALLSGPWVRRWQFAPEALPWTDRGAFLDLTAEKLQGIQAAALAGKLCEADLNAQTVDFAAHFPENQRSNVAGYAARALRSDKPRKVKLYSGSDDALRMWLNGQPIAQVLKLRGARADSECTEATLKAGDNVLLAEVSQGGGDWGLVLRIEDEDGTDLMLGDDDALTRAK